MPEIQKVSYTHDGMIDLVLQNPSISQGEIAAHFGYSQTWVSVVFNSDAFKARLEERKDEIIDPVLRATFDEKLRALADTSFNIIMAKLHATADPNLAHKSLELASRALGYGAKAAPSQQVNINVQPVAVVPAKEIDSQSWRDAFSPRRAAPQVIDVTPAPDAP